MGDRDAAPRVPRVRRSRDEILRDAGDLESLPFPAIDSIDASKRDAYAARSSAVRLWWRCASEREIKETTQLSAMAARRLVEKALEKDPLTGQPRGLFVCIPGYRNPRRKKPRRQKDFSKILAAQGRGRSGVLAACFSTYPSIERGMQQFARTRSIGKSPPVPVITRKACIDAFHALCRDEGLHLRSEWPFDARRRGEGAIWSWYLARKWDRPIQCADNELGDEAGKQARRDYLLAARDAVRGEGIAFDRLELDEHRLHSMFGLLVPGPGGQFLPCGTRRPWALALVDRGTWVCVASGLSHRARYDTNDVKRLLIRALRPPPRYMLSIQNANFCYQDDAAYPAEVLGPRLWRELAFDADTSHLSAESLLAAKEVLRCNVASERIADPTARSFVEGFYTSLASFMETMPASTGSNPRSAAYRGPSSAAVRYHIALPLAEELLDVYCRNWNSTAKAACGGVSPLALLQDKLATHHAFDKRLDAITASSLWKLLPKYDATITRLRGKSGPFRINFLGKYGSPALADHAELRYLRNTRVHLYVQEDARFAHAVPVERSDLVFPVSLIGPFSGMPHDIEFRRICLAMAKNEACAAKADSPHLMMGVLQGLGEAAQRSDGAAVLLAGTVSFMNRYGLGNEHYISLAAEVRQQLQDYASRADAAEEDAQDTAGGARISDAAVDMNLFGKL